jgi:hypothetical protein
MPLDVQKDGLAGVVRLIVFDGDVTAREELPPEVAKQVGEELIRYARDVETEQATLEASVDDGQLTLADDPSGEAFEDLLDSDDDVELGDVLNEDDPLKW